MKYILLILVIISASAKFMSFAPTIEIKKSGGYAEGAYVEWTGPNEKYIVYIVSGTKATLLDDMLVRNYSTYYRADAVGINAGKYTLRIVGKTSGIKETSAFSVSAFDRSGFHNSPKSPTYGKGMGAYNLDGTLKAGAQVLYVTEDNKKSVQMTIKGVKYTGVAAITQQIKIKNNLGPVAIRVVGRVSLDGLESVEMAGSFAMGVKEASEVTIEGIGNDATLLCGVAAYQSKNIEIRNLGFMLGEDGYYGNGITLQSTVGVWVHNNDLFYKVYGTDANRFKEDGSMNLKDDSQYVTISYNHFWGTGKTSICGMNKETGPNYISYHHNWFDHTDNSNPIIRSMSVHVYNNYYDGCYTYGVGVTYNGEAFVENNYFRNVKFPMLISLQGSGILTGDIFSGENGGLIKSFGNVMKSQNSFITYDKNKVEFDAYEVARRTDKIPVNVVGKVGGKTYTNFDTNSGIMYAYTPDNTNDIPILVMNSAGRAQKGDFSFIFFDLINGDIDLSKDNTIFLNGDNRAYEVILDDIRFDGTIEFPQINGDNSIYEGTIKFEDLINKTVRVDGNGTIIKHDISGKMIFDPNTKIQIKN